MLLYSQHRLLLRRRLPWIPASRNKRIGGDHTGVAVDIVPAAALALALSPYRLAVATSRRKRMALAARALACASREELS